MNRNQTSALSFPVLKTKKISFKEENTNDLAGERSTSTNTLNVFHIYTQFAKSHSGSSLNIPYSISMTSILSFPFPTQGNDMIFLCATFIIFLASFCFLAGIMTGKYIVC